MSEPNFEALLDELQRCAIAYGRGEWSTGPAYDAARAAVVVARLTALAAERLRAEGYREALKSISGLLTWNECATATPQVRLTKAEISNALDSTIKLARAALVGEPK